MTATEALERRIDELCRENEQLRQQVASVIDRSFKTADKMDCLDTENAKLRELVQAMKPFLCCMPFASCNTLAANVRNRMRELGIEVDK